MSVHARVRLIWSKQDETIVLSRPRGLLLASYRPLRCQRGSIPASSRAFYVELDLHSRVNLHLDAGGPPRLTSSPFWSGRVKSGALARLRALLDVLAPRVLAVLVL